MDDPVAILPHLITLVFNKIEQFALYLNLFK